MSSKKTTMIREESTQPNDTPDVLAYRVGQLEKAMVNGFAELKAQLNNLEQHYVSLRQHGR